MKILTCRRTASHRTPTQPLWSSKSLFQFQLLLSSIVLLVKIVSLFSSLTLILLRSKDFKETFFFKKEYSDAFEAFKMAAREFNWRRSLLDRFLACPGLLWLSRPNGLGQLSSGQDVAGGHSNMLIIFLFSVFCNFSCLLNFIFSLFIYMLLQFQHSRINTKIKP